MTWSTKSATRSGGGAVGAVQHHDEVDVAAAVLERAERRGADHVEPRDPAGEQPISRPEVRRDGALDRSGQHARSVPEDT
jgi:hypothetical protein